MSEITTAEFRRGFGQIYRALWRANEMTLHERAVLANILERVGQNANAWPGQATIADDLGVSERTVRDAIRGLQDRGFLEVKRRGQGLTNTYKPALEPIVRWANLPFQKRTGCSSREAPAAVLERHEVPLEEPTEKNHQEEPPGKVAAAAAGPSPLDSLSPAQRDVFGEIDLSMGRYMREPDIFSELLLFVQDYAPDEARECLRTVRARGEKAFPQNLRRVALAEIGGPLWQRERDKNRRAAFNQGGPYLCACGFAGSLSEVRTHKREQHEEGYA